MLKVINSLKDVDLLEIAEATGGYSPADLELLVKDAGMRALERSDLLDLKFGTPSAELIKTNITSLDLFIIHDLRN